MNYTESCNLRKNLPNIVKDKWIVKLEKLCHIIKELDNTHQQNLFIVISLMVIFYLNKEFYLLVIWDLCKPVEDFKSKIYKFIIFYII